MDMISPSPLPLTNGVMCSQKWVPPQENNNQRRPNPTMPTQKQHILEVTLKHKENKWWSTKAKLILSIHSFDYMFFPPSMLGGKFYFVLMFKVFTLFWFVCLWGRVTYSEYFNSCSYIEMSGKYTIFYCFNNFCGK